MAKQTARRDIRCYLCGHRFEVSTRTMSVPCPHCNRALKVEDITVKSYLPVNDLQTCGRITIAKGGRVVARIIRAGDGIECEGTIEGAIETDGEMMFGAKASWKGATLVSHRLQIVEGARLIGHVKVPWVREEPVKAAVAAEAKPEAPAMKTSATRRKTPPRSTAVSGKKPESVAEGKAAAKEKD